MVSPGVNEFRAAIKAALASPAAPQPAKYDGVRHEPMSGFGREPFCADVVIWLNQHLSRH
jgi:hypothetical protein